MEEQRGYKNRGGGADIIVNKKELQAACAIVRDSVLSSNENDLSAYHIFSSTFCENMETVFKNASRKYDSRYNLKLAASLILVVTISMCSVFAVNVEARNRFGKWILTTFNNTVIYKAELIDIFSNEDITISLDGIKNEYKIDVWSDDDDLIILGLQKDEETVLLSCQGESWIIGLSASDYKSVQTEVKNNPADFYEVLGGDGTNELFWLDESGCFLNLSGKLGLDEMKSLAERINIVKRK